MVKAWKAWGVSPGCLSHGFSGTSTLVTGCFFRRLLIDAGFLRRRFFGSSPGLGVGSSGNVIGGERVRVLEG